MFYDIMFGDLLSLHGDDFLVLISDMAGVFSQMTLRFPYFVGLWCSLEMFTGNLIAPLSLSLSLSLS